MAAMVYVYSWNGPQQVFSLEMSGRSLNDQGIMSHGSYHYYLRASVEARKLSKRADFNGRTVGVFSPRGEAVYNFRHGEKVYSDESKG